LTRLLGIRAARDVIVIGASFERHTPATPRH
jgi:hypothetical protein